MGPGSKVDANRAIRMIILIAIALTVPCAWLGMRMGVIVDIYSDDALLGIMAAPIEVWGDIAAYPLWIGTGQGAIMGALIGAVVPWCVVMGILLMRNDNARPGEEHGSARWAYESEYAPFAKLDNPDPKINTLILSKNAGLALSRKKFNMQYDRNLNVLVIGGSGTGKTRYYVKPNVLQMNGDYFITDPKGDLVVDVGQELENNGYDIRMFNTFVTDSSLVYNPLAYVKTDLDILSFAKMFIAMTQGTQKSSGDPFWEKAETLLYMAIIAYMRDYMPDEDYHMGTLLMLMGLAQASETDENAKSPLDCIFDELTSGYRYVKVNDKKKAASRPGAKKQGSEETVYSDEKKATYRLVPSPYQRKSDGKMPFLNRHSDGSRGWGPSGDDFAVENYTKFKQAAGKTLKSIIISCNVRLGPFTTREVHDIVCGEDQMHLERFGDEDSKNVVFAVFRDTDQRTLGFLHGIMVYQTVNILCQKALDKYGGRLPRCVNFLLDEYRSLNLPADISAMISVIRSRNLAMSIILQGVSQLTELYDEATAKSIRACCDTTLFLGAGATDEESRKFISDACGQQTVYDENVSSQHGGSGGWSRSGSKIARPLIDPAEVGRMPATNCIVLVRGQYPLFDEKYPLEQHPRYKELEAAGKFNLRGYLEGRRSKDEAAEDAAPSKKDDVKPKQPSKADKAALSRALEKVAPAQDEKPSEKAEKTDEKKPADSTSDEAKDDTGSSADTGEEVSNLQADDAAKATEAGTEKQGKEGA